MKTTKFYRVGIEQANRISKEETKMTQLGSMKYILWGPEKSEQSTLIKMGHFCQTIIKEQIKDTEGFLMLPTGVQTLLGSNKRKDIDLLFLHIEKKKVYYYELKNNIELDTEKLPATCEKIREITKYLDKNYPDFEKISGILCLSVFHKRNITERKMKNKIQQFASYGINVSFASDIFDILSIPVNEKEYYDFWREIGKIVRS